MICFFCLDYWSLPIPFKNSFFFTRIAEVFSNFRSAVPTLHQQHPWQGEKTSGYRLPVGVPKALWPSFKPLLASVWWSNTDSMNFSESSRSCDESRWFWTSDVRFIVDECRVLLFSSPVLLLFYLRSLS